MTINNLPEQRSDRVSPFDGIRQFNKDGIEIWSGRDLMGLLGYPRWSDFILVIDRAKLACQNSGNQVTEHFSGTSLKNPSGKGRPSVDYLMTRYACYLVALNGDPSKIEIAQAQSYFATKAREAELQSSQSQPMTQVQILLAAATQLAEQERRQLEIEQQQRELERQQRETVVRVDVVEQRLEGFNSANTGYHTVRAYCRLNGIKLSHDQALTAGKIAGRLCRNRGITIGKIPDEAYGSVNSYPSEILEEAIKQARGSQN